MPRDIAVKVIEPPDPSGTDAVEEVRSLYAQAIEKFPFGNPDGNASVFSPYGPIPPRPEEHYLRFTVFRQTVEDDILQKYAWAKVDLPEIVIFLGGGIGLVEPGYVVSGMPALLLQLKNDWQDRIYSILAWMKSSIFVWYCAVRLGDPDFYVNLQVSRNAFILPRKKHRDFYQELEEIAKNLILDESNFMKEINRLKKRGELDSDRREKLRARHNASANAACLALDQKVFKFLDLSKEDIQVIAGTIRDLRMSDFGLLESLEQQSG